MPRELPGLYWDEEKQRYFPLALSRRPQVVGPSTLHPPTKPQTAPQESHNLKRQRNRSLLRAREDARFSFRTSHKSKLIHQISCFQVAQTSHVASSSIVSLNHSAITAFQVGPSPSTYL
ncbi:hypothetical protein BD769DRAFT_1459840 [Suillus cothurnatus]|nr:hypothetical protein BD769DRAFT_1459840 [Suillus cothurnatus]